MAEKKVPGLEGSSSDARSSNVAIASVRTSQRKVERRIYRVRVLRSQRVPKSRQRLSPLSLRQAVLALSLMHECKIRESGKSAAMLRTQHASLELQRLAVECLGLPVLALMGVDVGQVVHETQRVGMLGAQHAALDLQCLAVERLSLRVGISDGLGQRMPREGRFNDVLLFRFATATERKGGAP